MAQQFICDKCGKIIKNTKTIYLTKENFDLCDDCFKRIESWLKSKEDNKTEFKLFG